MPQWDFLDFLAGYARRYTTFRLRIQTKVTALLEEGANVIRRPGRGPDASLDVRADLVVGADGRHSTVREAAGLKVQGLGAPIDVLWMRLSRRPDDPHQPAGRFDRGRVLGAMEQRAGSSRPPSVSTRTASGR